MERVVGPARKCKANSLCKITSPPLCIKIIFGANLKKDKRIICNPLSFLSTSRRLFCHVILCSSF